MSDPGLLRIQDYNYPLPQEKIAQFPLPARDASKLLVCRQGSITDDVFSNIAGYLPADSLLVFNNTRVIHARLIFRKPTGGQVEIFCLEPVSPSSEIQEAFKQRASSTWKCLVGNRKRWKSGPLVLELLCGTQTQRLVAEIISDYPDGCFEISFQWLPRDKTFAEILELAGLIPLPPYIDRDNQALDNERYQTVYAAHDGSVAAPTAGLHFTPQILDQLHSAGMVADQVTLHVGAGTFKPVVAEHVRDHVMHHEKIIVSKKTIENLVNSLHRPVIAVGTTSARTLESLYWAGARLICDEPLVHPDVSQWDPYDMLSAEGITPPESLAALLRYLESRQLEAYSGETRLMIVPGYRYRLLSGLITNFHMPQSTLLLLVAAMIGDDWRTAYGHALQHDYRFLSYGDACLFFMPGK